MSLKAYEDACTRAELFGQPHPDKEEFIAKNKHLDVAEFEEVEIKSSENTAILDEQLREGTSGLTELNTILNSTQTKINRLKGVCGSLTNFFRIKLTAKDNLSYSSEPSYIGQTNYDKDSIPHTDTEMSSINEGLLRTPKKTGDINSALEDLKEMEELENTNLVSKASVVDISQQVNSQISKLDMMINQADRAETSLSRQNKEMRSFLR